MTSYLGTKCSTVFCSWTICADIHPIAIILTEINPRKQIWLNLAQALLNLRASPLNSWAPSDSVAMLPRQQERIRNWQAAHAAHPMSSPKKPWHLSNLASTGSVPSPRSSFIMSLLTSKAQQGEQSPHPRQVTSAHKNAFGHFCSPYEPDSIVHGAPLQ